MKKMNLKETLEFKRHVGAYLYDLGTGTINDSSAYLRAANHHFEKIVELSGYEDRHELLEILDPFVCNKNGSPVPYSYYFNQMRDKGLYIMNDEEIEKATEEEKAAKKKRRKKND